MKNKYKYNIGLLIFFLSYIGALTLIYFRYPVVVPIQSTVNRTYNTVIIDAGHGGEDGGAVGVSGTPEKDLNLQIALYTAKYLDKKGYKVILTRDGDYATYSEEAKSLREKKVSDIHNRFDLIDKTKDCIFISIHMNHYGSSKCHGAQVFYSGNNKLSEKLASEIQNSIKKDVQPDNERKIKKSTSSIYILYHTDVPAALVECGFISNAEEEALLKDKTYQKKMATAISKGILSFLNK